MGATKQRRKPRLTMNFKYFVGVILVMTAFNGISADEGRNALDGINDFINVTEAFNSINWANIEAELFTARDRVSDRVVDAYEKARQKLREMPTCEIHGDPADDSTACHTAKKLYVQTQKSIDDLKRKIGEIKAASDTSPSRQKRALEVERRIEQIEQQPIRSDSGKTAVKLTLLFSCLLASVTL